MKAVLVTLFAAGLCLAASQAFSDESDSITGSETVSGYPSLESLDAKCQPRVRYGVGDEISFHGLDVRAGSGKAALNGREVVFVPGLSDAILDRLILKGNSPIPRFRLNRSSTPGPGYRTYFGDVEKLLGQRGVPTTIVRMPEFGIAGPSLMGQAVKAALIADQLPKVLVCHSYGFDSCLEALLSMSPEQLGKLEVLLYQPAVGGSALSEGMAFALFPLDLFPVAGVQFTRPSTAKQYFVPKIPRLCALAEKLPISVIVASAPQAALSGEAILRLFQDLAGYPGGIDDVDGPHQCPWSDGFIFADQASIPCAAVTHLSRRGSHVPFYEPGSSDVDHLIDEWGSAIELAGTGR